MVGYCSVLATACPTIARGTPELSICGVGCMSGHIEIIFAVYDAVCLHRHMLPQSLVSLFRCR
jgi:hypothetical protein